MLSGLLSRLFTAHPAAAHETYFQHWVEAMWIGCQLAGATAAVCIHAFVPALFPTTASGIARRVGESVDRRMGGGGVSVTAARTAPETPSS